MARRIGTWAVISWLCSAVPVLGESPDSLAAEPLQDLSRTEFVQPNLGEKLDRILSGFSRSGFSGAVSIGWGGLVALHKAYGFADREREIPNEIDTAYPIGSLTMQFTAVAILQLADQGRLRLDDRIGEHLGPFPGQKGEATILDLLTNRAGLVADEDRVLRADRDAFLREVRQAPPDFPPGHGHRLSRVGFLLLAAIIETVSGQSYETYLRERVFLPAGMRTARFVGDPPIEGSPVAIGYQGGRTALSLIGNLPLPRYGIGLVGPHLRSRAGRLEAAPPPPYDWTVRGAEGIVATVGDLLRWELALRGDQILSDESRQRIFSQADQAEAYGWRIEKTKRASDRYHKGSAGSGYATEFLRYGRFLRYVDKDLVVILVINNDMGWSKPVWRSIEEFTYGEDYSTPFAALAILIILIVVGGATTRTRRGPRRPRRSRERLATRGPRDTRGTRRPARTRRFF